MNKFKLLEISFNKIFGKKNILKFWYPSFS